MTAISVASPASRVATLPVILTGIFMPMVDFFIVNVAIPSMQHSMHAGSAAVQWMVAGYGLAYGAGLITGGRLGDLYGRRQMFTLGLIFFTIASAACGFAPTAGALVAARVVQGVAAALLVPQVLAILRMTYEGAEQARAMAAYGVTLGLASVFGQLIGGLLMRTGLEWRACFLINVPIGLIALARARRVVPPTPRASAARLDLGGMALVSLGLIAVVLPLIEGRELGWPLWTWLTLAAAPVLFLLYGWRRHPAPLVDVSIFRERAFSVGVISTTTLAMGMAGYFLIFALFVQEGRGLDPLRAGLIFVPMGAGYMATSMAGPRLIARFGRQVIAIGGVTRALGLGLLLLTLVSAHSAGWLIPALLIDGAGMGLALAPLAGVVLSRVAPGHAGVAAGMVATSQQVGGAIGVALIGLVFYGALDGGGAGIGAGGDYTHAFQLGAIYVIGVSAVLSLLVQLLPRDR